MAQKIAILSRHCKNSLAFADYYGDKLHSSGFRLIVLDADNQQLLTKPLKDLLWALQVTEVPCIHSEGTNYMGSDAFSWAYKQGWKQEQPAAVACGSSLKDIEACMLIANWQLHNIPEGCVGGTIFTPMGET